MGEFSKVEDKLELEKRLRKIEEAVGLRAPQVISLTKDQMIEAWCKLYDFERTESELKVFLKFVGFE